MRWTLSVISVAVTLMVDEATTEEVSYCGWALDAIRNDVDCRPIMRDPSDVHMGGCKTNECRSLDDCVMKCNRCNVCQAILYAEGAGDGIQCHMQGATGASAYQSSNPNVVGGNWYINKRDIACLSSSRSRRLNEEEEEEEERFDINVQFVILVPGCIALAYMLAFMLVRGWFTPRSASPFPSWLVRFVWWLMYNWDLGKFLIRRVFPVSLMSWITMFSIRITMLANNDNLRELENEWVGPVLVILGSAYLIARDDYARRRCALWSLWCAVLTGRAPASSLARVAPSSGLDDGEEGREEVECTVDVPQYWTNQKNSSFDQMVLVNKDMIQLFNELLQVTYVAKATQDRLCPKLVDPCAKTPGGCACVQVGGDPGLPTKYIVRRVIRCEDSGMWQQYVTKRDKIREKRNSEFPLNDFDPPIMTDEFTLGHPQAFEPLDEKIHETFLWHGTKVRTALAIAQNDFRIEFAGTGGGTMYGEGIYMAESCTKADEYAHDEDGYYKGVFALLLCRACLGKSFYTMARQPDAADQVKAGNYDSTCGDRLKSVGTYREFVVYDADQVYPEYVVLYSRIFAGDNEEEMRKSFNTQMQLQLPAYWMNAHRNPGTEPFAKMYNARQKTISIIQHLVNGTTKKKLKVVDCKRVEHSETWMRYIGFKNKLRNEDVCKVPDISGQDAQFDVVQCITPNELDGNSENGHTITSVLMEQVGPENAISLDNLDSTINEFLLWHGSSPEAVASISSTGFRIPIGSSCAHGARFGHGAYFAEDLDKSMSYATMDEEGQYHVLLCRTTCGQFYYTENLNEVDADKNARAAGKHSVLANPLKKGPREFIVLQEEQVYPEFIVYISE